MALVPSTSKSPTPGKETPRKGIVDRNFVPERPLDYSFKNITDLSELENEAPRSSNGQDEDGKYRSRCIRINNNILQNMAGLPKAINDILTNGVDEITWIDLSFNELTKIDPILCSCQALKILYLHGNSINNIDEVDKLGGLPLLMNLTLHGSPIDSVKNYRWYVLSQIPHLKHLDFSTVTKADRKTAIIWRDNNPTKKKKKKDVEQ